MPSCRGNISSGVRQSYGRFNRLEVIWFRYSWDYGAAIIWIRIRHGSHVFAIHVRGISEPRRLSSKRSASLIWEEWLSGAERTEARRIMKKQRIQHR